MRARWPWLAVVVLLFLGGAVAGWALSDSRNAGRAEPQKRTDGQGRLDWRIRQLEDEVEKEHGKKRAEERNLLPSDPEAGVTPRGGGLAGTTVSLDRGKLREVKPCEPIAAPL